MVRKCCSSISSLEGSGGRLSAACQEPQALCRALQSFQWGASLPLTCLPQHHQGRASPDSPGRPPEPSLLQQGLSGDENLPFARGELPGPRIETVLRARPQRKKRGWQAERVGGKKQERRLGRFSLQKRGRKGWQRDGTRLEGHRFGTLTHSPVGPGAVAGRGLSCCGQICTASHRARSSSSSNCLCACSRNRLFTAYGTKPG